MAAVIAQGLTGEGDPLSPTATGPALTRLVARSLVARDGGRWKVLESIRAFGLARAEEAGELPELRRRLAGWVVTLARTYTIAVRGRGGDLGEITRQADTEVDNIRGAFSPDVLFLLPEDAGLPGILDYFALRGRAMEAMALVGPLAERENPEALYRMGQFWSVLGDTEQGLAACERGHAELARRSASGRLSHWERACSFQLDAVEARLLAQAGRTEESLAIVSTTVERHADVLDDVDRLVMDALHAALLIDLGRLDDAADLLHHGLALARSLGSSGFVLSNLSNLAVVRLRQENLDEAEMLLHEVLEARESVGDRLGMGSTLLNIADLAIRRGDPARAAACADQAIGIAVDTGRLPLLEIAFRTIAELIVPTDPVRAAHFLGAADKVMDRVGVRPGSQAAEVLPLEANLEASLGAAGLASARASGHARDLDTSIADARAAASAISSG
jgi:tetratricopeptide (TPR) repeat protein